MTINDLRLENLRLSARVRRFLIQRDIHTIDQLCSLPLHDVLTSPSLGRADIAQIAGELDQIGRKWPIASDGQPEKGRVPLDNEMSLRLHALFAASAGDTVELEMTVAGQTVTRFDLLGLLRAEAEECEPACRAKYLRYSADDLRRVADLLDQLASTEPSEA